VNLPVNGNIFFTRQLSPINYGKESVNDSTGPCKCYRKKSVVGNIGPWVQWTLQNPTSPDGSLKVSDCFSPFESLTWKSSNFRWVWYVGVQYLNVHRCTHGRVLICQKWYSFSWPIGNYKGRHIFIATRAVNYSCHPKTGKSSIQHNLCSEITNHSKTGPEIEC
jgi:hypothetical protein